VVVNLEIKDSVPKYLGSMVEYTGSFEKNSFSFLIDSVTMILLSISFYDLFTIPIYPNFKGIS